MADENREFQGKEEKSSSSYSFADYLPLLIILLVALISGWSIEQRSKYFQWRGVIMAFMGFFFVQLSLLKLFDIRGFVAGFSKYDLITEKFPVYGYFYPFIELLLGLLFFTLWVPILTKILTVVIMGISAAGVFRAITDKKALMCACMGTTIRLPLSIVSLIENVGMGVLAIIMLF